MRIACIGTGFVGVVTTAVLAKLGHTVIGLDIDPDKIHKLKQGIIPFFEPGLSDLLLATQQAGHLTFTTSYQEAISQAEIILLMVGTPSNPDGSANLSAVFAAVDSCIPYLTDGVIIVIKSTVPPGTNQELKKRISQQTKINFHLASVPEFLKEGTAVEDTLHPDRVVLGVEDSETEKILRQLHAPLTSNIVVMNPESAQMTKYAANNYLATRITFINQIADLCEHNGADIEEVIKGIGADRRIGSHYWYPGLGYGGSCFPKDVREIAAYAQKIGEADSLFIKIDALNSARIPKLMAKYDQLVGGFAGKTVGILGLSFKKNTNDTRVAPAEQVISYLHSHQAVVKTADPKVPADTLDPYQAATGAHVLMLLVEWDEYLKLDLPKLSNLMQEPKYFLDTRNQYLPSEVTQAGLQYAGVGR